MKRVNRADEGCSQLNPSHIIHQMKNRPLPWSFNSYWKRKESISAISSTATLAHFSSSPTNTFVHLKAKIPAKVTQNAASFLHKFLFWKPGFTSELAEGHFSWLLWQYLPLKEILTKRREGRNKLGPINVMFSEWELGRERSCFTVDAKQSCTGFLVIGSWDNVIQ